MLAALAILLSPVGQPHTPDKVQVSSTLSVEHEFPDRTQIVEQQRAEAAAAQAAAEEAARQADLSATANRMQPKGSYANTYAPGNCTWYVASRIPVPSYMGNAKFWAGSLVSAGWRSGPPRRGAIAQTTLGWAGHVAVVESVNADGTVVISEMNYNGLFMVDTRVAPQSDFTYLY